MSLPSVQAQSRFNSQEITDAMAIGKKILDSIELIDSGTQVTTMKNIGEKSLVDLYLDNYRAKNKLTKIVSNNRVDITDFLRIKCDTRADAASMMRYCFQPILEFYYYAGKRVFGCSQNELAKFMIIANYDLQVKHKELLGNIMTYSVK